MDDRQQTQSDGKNLILKMASHWLKNWKSLKIFFRTTEWIETRFSQNAGTAHPPRADKSSLKSDHYYLPFEILDSNHIPSCTSAGSVLQMCKVS
jgi:hypothetical protein